MESEAVDEREFAVLAFAVVDRRALADLWPPVDRILNILAVYEVV